MQRGTRLVLVGLLVWFCLALGLGLTGRFENAGAIGVAITIWSLTILILALSGFVPPLRDWATAVDPTSLVALHLTRFVGIYFLILCERGDLPPGFAKPAGIGDIAVATLALVILVTPFLRRSRAALMTWNTLGLIDILLVVGNALRIGLANAESM